MAARPQAGRDHRSRPLVEVKTSGTVTQPSPRKPVHCPGGDYPRKVPMKLTQIALVAAVVAGFASPSFAAMTKEEMTAMKAEMAQSGKTDQERMAFWKTMKPERQAAWTAACKNQDELSSTDVGD